MTNSRARPLSTFADLVRLLAGWANYGLTQQTKAYAQSAMIRQFCRTGGRSNELMAKAIAAASSRYKIPVARGVLGDLGPEQLDRIVRDISENGYHVFERRLPPEVCQRLLDCALNCRADMVSIVQPGVEQARVPRYNRDNPEAVKYECAIEDLVADDAVQSLIADDSVIAVAQAYLKTAPVLDNISLSWNTAQKEPDSAVAQFYHFDMDRVKWLRYFIYVTDVGEDNGPHVFIAKSHRPGGIPADLLERGYARLPDSEVSQYYSPDRIRTFTGPSGTVIAEDTRGLHKGTMVQRGDRLLFHLEWSMSLFGSTYDRFPMPARVNAVLQSAMARYPKVFRLFSV